MTDEEERRALAVLNSPRFVDKPPKHIYATLLAEGDYLCSISTMYVDVAHAVGVPPRMVPEQQRCCRPLPGSLILAGA